jgi:predicted nucleic acid-binding protein
VAIPPGGSIYLDTNALIYTGEKNPTFWPLLEPVWHAAKFGRVRVATTALSLMEVLVGPLKTGNAGLIAVYEAMLHAPEVDLIPIDESVLREAARLRAIKTGLRTPDAIHAATAVVRPTSLFLTNDPDFRKVPGLPVTVLSDLLSP